MIEFAPSAAAAPHAERVDVLIVGAGISGIGAAKHLRRNVRATAS